MELKEEWEKIISQSEHIYIYGAGKIGKKIYNLLKKKNQLEKLEAFVVSDNKGQPTSIEEKPVIQIEELDNKKSTIFVSVSDIYQNEIIELLEKLGFENIICAYKFSFLDESDIPKKIPDSIIINIRELLVQQYSNNEFGRYDIFVRLLAIEEYYNKNNIGFALYKKMQNLRVHPQYAQSAEKRFKLLIKSFEEKGYDETSEIIVDKNLKLLDGSHRIALAIYHNTPKVKIRIVDRITDIEYGLSWFKQYFTDEECKVLHDRQKKCSDTWSYFVKGIIWPSASSYFQKITDVINEKYEGSCFKDYFMPKEIFIQFVRGVYHIDDIAQWKIESKITHFGDREIYPVRVLDINMHYPDFRVKNTGTTISQEGEKLKKIIRNNYKDKIENYFYDIIFHTADNYSQSEYINALLEQAISLKDIFAQIEDMEWMIIKSENDYFPKDFPDTYPAYKDIDLICKKEDANEIGTKIFNFVNENINKNYSVKITEKKDISLMIRIEKKDFLILAIEVIYADTYLKDDFILNSISKRIKRGGYYISSIEDENVFRVVEFYKNQTKKRHLAYVKNNINIFNKEQFLQNVNDEYKEVLEQFIIVNGLSD